MGKMRSGLSLAIAGGLLIFSIADAALAQRFVPKNRGLPGRREGSGTRGACVQTKSSVVALMPPTNAGTTVADYPTLFWYVPATQPTTASFLLLDEQQRELYSSDFQITGQAGLISISLPPSANLPPLVVGKTYHWKFAVTCDEDDLSNTMLTEGWIQRVELTANLRKQLQAAALPEQAAIYAKEGIWHDAATTLINLRRSQPTNAAIANNWQTLLNSVDLDRLVQVPLTPQTVPLISEKKPSAKKP